MFEKRSTWNKREKRAAAAAKAFGFGARKPRVEEVTCVCGDREVMEVFGPWRELPVRLSWLKEHWLCQRCWKKLGRRAARENRRAGLLELEGTKLQRPWAEIIRWHAHQESGDVPHEVSAHWWIENR